MSPRLCLSSIIVLNSSLAFTSAFPAESVPPLPVIGKIAPREARDIAGSDWSIGAETLDRDLADYAKYKSYLGPLGAKSVRLQAGWAKTEKTAGIYSWEWLDAIVDDALAQGVRPWIQLSYGNPIYKDGGGPTLGDPLPGSPEALAAWDAWAAALVDRYRDRVSEWEVWNEPDLTPRISADDYAALYIRTAEIIRSRQPQAKIYALSLASDVGFADAFLAFLQARNKLPLIDAITFHGYPLIPDNMDCYRALRAVTDRYSPLISLRQGESGAPSAPTTGALGRFQWTETIQAKWNLRRLMVHRGEDIPMSLFTLSEFVYNDPHRQGLNSKGLVAIRPDFSVERAKTAYSAAQNVFSIFDCDVRRDHRIVGFSDSEDSLAVAAYRRSPDQSPIIAVWFNGRAVSENNDYKIVNLRLQGAKFTDPVYVDLRTGVVHAIPADQWVLTERNTRFETLPVYDSPILIMERKGLAFSGR